MYPYIPPLPKESEADILEERILLADKTQLSQRDIEDCKSVKLRDLDVCKDWDRGFRL